MEVISQQHPNLSQNKKEFCRDFVLDLQHNNVYFVFVVLLLELDLFMDEIEMVVVGDGCVGS